MNIESKKQAFLNNKLHPIKEKKMKYNQHEQLFTELTPEEGAMIEGGVSVVLIRDVGPVIAGAPTQGDASAFAAPNPTLLQVTNNTGLNLSYDLDFAGAPNAGDNLSIANGAVEDFNGTAGTAIATWDVMLNLPEGQNLSQELTPGRRYEFYAAA